MKNLRPTASQIALADLLERVVDILYNQTGRPVLRAIEVDKNYGLSIGLGPGESMDIYTSAGMIRIRSQWS
jgi:hypothetical protein